MYKKLDKDTLFVFFISLFLISSLIITPIDNSLTGNVVATSSTLNQQRSQNSNQITNTQEGITRNLVFNSLLVGSKKESTYSYFHKDRMNSNRLQSDEFGNKISEFKSLPYGQAITKQNIRQAFTGKELDENNIYNFQARYYDPSMGIFTSVDPVTDNHAFGYVNNNPLNYVDPDGKDRHDIHFYMKLLKPDSAFEPDENGVIQANAIYLANYFKGFAGVFDPKQTEDYQDLIKLDHFAVRAFGTNNENRPLGPHGRLQAMREGVNNFLETGSVKHLLHPDSYEEITQPIESGISLDDAYDISDQFTILKGKITGLSNNGGFIFERSETLLDVNFNDLASIGKDTFDRYIVFPRSVNENTVFLVAGKNSEEVVIAGDITSLDRDIAAYNFEQNVVRTQDIELRDER